VFQIKTNSSSSSAGKLYCVIQKNSSQPMKNKMEEYRERLEEDPIKCQAIVQAAANRRYRWHANHTLSEEEKQRKREKTNIRMQKYREKKRLEKRNTAGCVSVEEKTETSVEKEKQREHWRQLKRKEKERMTPEKRLKINELRRQRYAEKKNSKDKLKIDVPSTSRCSKQC
jgi:DNA-binding XRE family transcriptional regulator